MLEIRKLLDYNKKKLEEVDYLFNKSQKKLFVIDDLAKKIGD